MDIKNMRELLSLEKAGTPEQEALINERAYPVPTNRAQRRKHTKMQQKYIKERRQLQQRIDKSKAKKAVKKAMTQPTVMYECDPIKHSDCLKTNCFLGGGPCHQTTKLEYARQPVQTANLVVPVSGVEREELIRQYAEELKNK